MTSRFKWHDWRDATVDRAEMRDHVWAAADAMSDEDIQSTRVAARSPYRDEEPGVWDDREVAEAYER